MALEQPKKITGGAFGRYMAEHRAALLKELPGKPATASIKLGSERFKALSESEKAKYEKKYLDAKAQYEKDLKAFLAAGGEMKKVARGSKKDKKEKKVKDPNRPKKPAGGAYGCYLAKNRADFIKQCAGKPITAVSKLAGELWKGLSDAEKAPFEKEYIAKKAAYEKAMKDYVPPAGATNDKEDEDDDEENEDEDEEEEGEEEEEDSPKKRKADTKVDAPAAKKGKTGSGQASTDVEGQAKKLGYQRQMKVLSENPKIKASPAAMLDALQKENGSVVAARKALLGA